MRLLINNQFKMILRIVIVALRFSRKQLYELEVVQIVT